MLHGTFVAPDLTTFTRLDQLGLEVIGQLVEQDRAALACRVVEPDDWCRRCGCQGRARDTLVRRLAHVPFGWRPTTLVVTVRRYRCVEGGLVWRQDTSLAAEPRSKLSRAALRWALVALVVQHLTVARIAEVLAVIAKLNKAVPAGLTEVAILGRTLKKRSADVLAFFDQPGTSNGPTEAINGGLEHLRGSSLGFRHLTHYIARALLETGGFRPLLHPRL